MGTPIQNPFSWTWRYLCRRMGLMPSGLGEQQLEGAIEATAGPLIKSHHTLYSKPASRLLRNQDEFLHLCERVAFIGSELAGGDIADANDLWLSEWYLDDIIAIFTAPHDSNLHYS